MIEGHINWTNATADFLTTGTLGAGAATFSGNVIIPDAGNIGSASDTDAIAIAGDGKTTFSQDANFSEDILIGDAKYIGSASDPDAIQIEADGDVVLTQKLYAAALYTSETIYHTGDADTYIYFSTGDQVHLVAGNLTMFSVKENIVTQDEVIVNDGGVDIDFRVEATGQANALFVQGSDGKVGVRDNAPGSVFDVTGDINTTEQYKVDDVQVVTNQQAHIADSSTQDLTGTDSIHQANLESDLANIVAAVNSILSTMETHGLVAAA
jgi:hypothetical protein